jgi:hypothetical protein
MARSVALLALTCLVVLAGCGSGRETAPSPSPRAVERLVFAYGVGARNVLDTGAGTFTKDLIADPPVTARLRLTDEELGRIDRRLEAMDFWSYPRRYETIGEGGRMEPHSSYRWEVTTGDGTKVVLWEDAVSNGDERAAALRSLARLIQNMIESKAAYKAMPAPSGGYL